MTAPSPTTTHAITTVIMDWRMQVLTFSHCRRWRAWRLPNPSLEIRTGLIKPFEKRLNDLAPAYGFISAVRIDLDYSGVIELYIYIYVSFLIYL